MAPVRPPCLRARKARWRPGQWTPLDTRPSRGCRELPGLGGTVQRTVRLGSGWRTALWLPWTRQYRVSCASVQGRAGSAGGQKVRVGLGLVCPQEEESPCGEVTLKRDRSFSEHDLVQLRSEVASGLQLATQPPGGLEPSRARAGSMHTWRPSTQEQGKCRLSPPFPRPRPVLWVRVPWPTLSAPAQAGTPHFFNLTTYQPIFIAKPFLKTKNMSTIPLPTGNDS